MRLRERGRHGAEKGEAKGRTLRSKSKYKVKAGAELGVVGRAGIFQSLALRPLLAVSLRPAKNGNNAQPSQRLLSGAQTPIDSSNYPDSPEPSSAISSARRGRRVLRCVSVGRRGER